jgi:hypothetical protein
VVKMANKNDISNLVLQKIAKEKISIRSKYLVLAEKLGLSGGLALTIIASIIFVNFILYWLKSSDNLEFLSFGNQGILAFLQSFPYLLVTGGIVFLVLASLLLKKFDISYKKPYRILVVCLVLLTFFISGIMAISGANEKLEQAIIHGRLRSLKPFIPLPPRKGIMGRNGLIGEIMEIEKNYFTIQAGEKKVKINFDQNTHFPMGSDFSIGDKIGSIGKFENDEFEAIGIRIINHRLIQQRIEKGINGSPSGDIKGLEDFKPPGKGRNIR